MEWTPFLSDSVYLVPETVFSFLPFILICVFLECFPFFQERVTLYLPRYFFLDFILILEGLPGRSFFFGAVPEIVCWLAGVSGETVEEGDGGRLLAAKPS